MAVFPRIQTSYVERVPHFVLAQFRAMGGVGSPTSSEFHLSDDKSPPRLVSGCASCRIKLECMRSPKAWLFNTLRVLSRGIYIAKDGSLRDRVGKLLVRIREKDISYFHSFFENGYSSTLLNAVHDRLANRPRGPRNKLRILHAWADGAGRASSIFDVSRWSSSSLHLESAAHAW